MGVYGACLDCHPRYGEDVEPVDPDRLDRDREGLLENLDAMKKPGTS